MSSIFAALKFGSADNDKNSKLPESENSSSVVKSVESTLKTDTPVAQGEKKPSPCCCCKETKQKRDAWYVELMQYIVFSERYSQFHCRNFKFIY